MVQNKKLLDELKKYNGALEKHFVNLDFDSLSQLSESSSNLSQNPEFYSIVATSIMDTKTEMALLRKNLSVEIEGMTKRMIAEEQNNFKDQMNKFYGKIIFELKENLNSHVIEINSNVSELKREVGNFSKNNKEFSKTLDNIGQEIRDFKKDLILLEELSIRNNNSNEVFSKLSNFEDKLDKLLTEITKKNIFIENNSLGLNKKIAQIETKVITTDKSLMYINDSISKLETKVIKSDKNLSEEIIINLEKKFSDQKSNFEKLLIEKNKKPNFNLENKPLLEVKTEVLSESNLTEKNVIEIKAQKIDSKIQKILEINKRIEKLESLR